MTDDLTQSQFENLDRYEVTYNYSHKVTYTRRRNREWEAVCSCTATWTHKKDETAKQMRSIYESHLKYFNRPKMETL